MHNPKKKYITKVPKYPKKFGYRIPCLKICYQRTRKIKQNAGKNIKLHQFIFIMFIADAKFVVQNWFAEKANYKSISKI
jgi:hypothetical protein